MAELHSGVLTKGIELRYREANSAGEFTGDFTKLNDLQEIPDLGGTTDTVEVTTFDDAAHMFIKGLLSYGDSVDFTFLYASDQFIMLSEMDGQYEWQVYLPEDAAGNSGITCTFLGECAVRINGQGTNEAIQYTLQLTPMSTMEFAVEE